MFLKTSILLLLVAFASATPTGAFWKDTFFGSTVEEMRSLCNNDEDIMACIKFKTMTFLDNIFNKDSYQVSDNVEVTRNSKSNEVSAARSEESFESKVENYIQTHDVTFKMPFVDSKVTLDARNLNDEEIDLKIKFSNGVGEARKSKLKKIFIPILVFVLLKAITLIPLALGILGLKAWNALQLSFFSFVVSVSLAVFQLCKKIAADNAHPHISAHGGWEAVGGHYARSFDDDDEAQQLAYNGYTQ